MVVGAVIQDYYGIRHILLDRPVCVYDVPETNSSGNERMDYT